jgi:hypothetical protein
LALIQNWKNSSTLNATSMEFQTLATDANLSSESNSTGIQQHVLPMNPVI